MSCLNFKEKELHPYLVYFAHQQFGCYSKTIDEGKSHNKQAGENEWIHPDIVSFKLMRNDFTPQVQSLYRNMNQDTAYLYSFELKREVKLCDLKKYYFQAVSNSSWANEGYLVTAILDTSNQGLMDELERLVQAFGIGVILLNLGVIEQSQILFEAKKRNELDFYTINKLIKQENSDFIEFVKVVNLCLEAKDETIESAVIKQGMDKIERIECLSLTKSNQEIDVGHSQSQNINEKWFHLKERDFTHTKIKKIKINSVVLDATSWRDFLRIIITTCKKKNSQLFYENCFSNQTGSKIFLKNRAEYWNEDREKEYEEIEKNIYLYSSLSAQSTCREVCRILELFNIPIENVSIRIEDKIENK